jgi:hypothetical protein
MVAQLLMGTSPVFAMGVFYFIMVTAVSFNMAGGMNTFSGSFIAFMSLETIIISQVAKLFYGQAADTNLMTPLTTISVYDAGITCIAFAAFITSKYRRKSPIFNAEKDANRLVGMSIASSIIGIASLLLVGLYGFDGDLSVKKGDIFGFLNQFGGFVPLGVLLGTAFIIQKSNGTRSARWWTILPMIFLTLDGIALQTKAGIFSPALMWLLVCAAYGYRLNKKQVIGVVSVAIFAAYIIFPVVQYMRGFTRTGDLINRGRLVYEYLAENSLLSIRENYIATEQLKEEGSADGYFYYGTDKGMLDRMSLIETEDAIIYRTEVSMPRGAGPMIDGFLSMIPRVIWTDKAKWEAGSISMVNVMGREIGILAPTDETTYISFSIFGSTFFMVGWAWSAALILVVMIPMFLLMDSFYGSVRTNMFALFVVLGNMHGAPEFTLPAIFGTLIHEIILTAMILWFIRALSPAITMFLGKNGLLNVQEAPRAVIAVASDPILAPRLIVSRPAAGWPGRMQKSNPQID